MFIAIVDFQTRPEDQLTALAALAHEAETVRSMKGCRRFRALTVSGQPGSICIQHEWDSAEDFANYVASPSFTESGIALRPLMVGATESRRFTADLLETV
ncbi:antibiotic biosynthesis monooxygenase [Frigidibacter sp. RF13]|uniref:putative quinol monooxygenase n=1 Tax=Frigidibacter sp. RF13 TaxID=2997340 RepID=UPI0022713ADA|nr:antibiotic biosynthesis monooxygenase [Frigidibacter sp. RF13]MCY1126125.1 antibiotic biosynthesis monooxygenase [Frigidibacter sp. RF13]